MVLLPRMRSVLKSAGRGSMLTCRLKGLQVMRCVRNDPDNVLLQKSARPAGLLLRGVEFDGDRACVVGSPSGEMAGFACYGLDS